MHHQYFVYLLTNPKKTVPYMGVTNDLVRRLDEHMEQEGRPHTFTGRYFRNLLVHWEEYFDIRQAIAREKEIKGWRREKKDALVTAANPTWRTLNNDING